MRILAVLILLVSSHVAMADTPELALRIHEHRFEPAELKVPAGTKVKLVIRNDDATPEEFESHELNREKLIPGNSSAVVFIGPLKPGRYPFFGEFNEDSARGVVIVE